MNHLYTQLRHLLADQQWQLADSVTREIMLKITGADTQVDHLMSKQQISHFPCEHLIKIDDLWVKYSQNHFGFSVINKIYYEVEQDYQELSKLVGWYNGDRWINYQAINFTHNAPRGHLPLTWLVPSTFSSYWLARFASHSWRAILERMTQCQQGYMCK